MITIKRIAALLLALACASVASAATVEEKRDSIDEMSEQALTTLFEKDKHAGELYKQSYGYAVFSNFKISFGISGGGGRGVAVDKRSGERVYMNMGTGGLNIGLGAQKYQVIFLFQTRDALYDFVIKGWQADTSANAVAGTAGANAEATFSEGVAYYQLTEGGLMLQADIAGTKYWKSPKLNNRTDY